MTGDPAISVVIPVWNEDPRNLRALHARLRHMLDRSQEPWEVVFVDDASGDVTARTLEALANTDGRVRLLRQRQRGGQEAAIVRGILEARGELICVMDCDLQHRPEDIPRMLKPLRDGYDLVLGVRRVCARGDLRRQVVTRIYTAVMNARWGARISDWGCGFNAGRQEAFGVLRGQIAGGIRGPLKLALTREARRWTQVQITQDTRQFSTSGYRGWHFWRHAARMLVYGTSAELPDAARLVPSGNGRVLLDEDDDLTAEAVWSHAGYTVAPFLTPEAYAALRFGIRGLVYDLLEQLRIEVDRHAPLEQYHRLIGRHDDVHERVVRRLNKLPLWRLPVAPARLAERVSAICGIPVTLRNPHFGVLAGVLSVFGVRIIRPQSTDHNPMHRDVWIGRLRHAVNIYVPVAGSTAQSSLGLVPGSHRWSEGEIERTRRGATVNGRRYTVPTVTGAAQPLSMVRPNPGDNEVLVFSPYLIHGGAGNFNADATRVSLEMRFWRVQPGRRR